MDPASTVTAMQPAIRGVWDAFCLLLGCFVSYSIYKRIREGAVMFAGTRVLQSENPGTFWAVVSMASVGAVALLYQGSGFLL